MPTLIALPRLSPIVVPQLSPPIIVGLVPRTAIGIVTQGPQGAPGPTFPGFGQVTYTDREIGFPGDNFQAGVRQQIQFGPATTSQDLLNPPFDAHAFLVGDRITPRAYGDVYHITVNLLVTAQQDSAVIKVDIDVGSPLGPTGSTSQMLSQSAGTSERVTFPLIVQALEYMMANGAALFLTANVGCSIVSEAIIIEPSSTQGDP